MSLNENRRDKSTMKLFFIKTLGLIVSFGIVFGLSTILNEKVDFINVNAASSENYLINFDNIANASAVISQQDLSSYGVTKGELTLTSNNTDTGKGLQVGLNQDGTRFCQGLTYTNTANTTSVFDSAGEYQYLRIWINNPDLEEIGISIYLSGGNKFAIVNSSQAKVVRCDGTILTTKTVDCAGVGGTYHVMVPGAFSGWIAWPLTSKLEKAWNNTLMTSFTETTEFKLDVRPQAAGASSCYVLDDVCLSSTINGQKRTYVDPTTAGLTEKKQELNNMINGYLGINPKVTELPQYNPDSNPESGVNSWSDIKAITYDGATINGKKTKIFAYIGFPKNASSTNKVPAVVLVHGGGGYVYAEWVKLWNDKGYAAIAMSTTGYFPSAAGKGIAGRETDYYQKPAYWQYGLYGEFIEAGYVNAPNNDSMGSSGNAIDTQWMYHSVTQTILAHNILLNDNRIKADKIGINGISWGGIISSIAIGYDYRYSFAVPVYGSGYLDKGLSYQYDYFSPVATKTLWSASDKFSNVKFPVLWLGWSNDPNFSIQSNSLSYEATKSAGSILSMKVDWSHGHSAGWLPSEIYRFTDAVVKGGNALTTCVNEPGTSKNISFTINKPADATSVTAKAWYLSKKMTYSMNGILTSTFKVKTIDQTWASIDCTVNGNTITGKLPTSTYSYYVEITTKTAGGTFVTSTKYVTIDPTNSGINVSGSSKTGNSSQITNNSTSNNNSPADGSFHDNNSETDSISSNSNNDESGNDSNTSDTGISNSESKNTTPKTGNILLAVILGGIVLLLAAGGIFYFVKFKKRRL